MSDKPIMGVPPLRTWLHADGRFSRAEVVVSSLEIGPLPGGGVAILQHRDGEVAWRLDLARDVALALAARIVAAAG